MSDYSKTEPVPGVTVKTTAYIADYWKLGHELGSGGADHVQVMFLHGLLEGFKSLDGVGMHYQLDSMSRVAESKGIDLTELADMMQEYLGGIR